MKKQIIINADDFGYSDHTVDWTIRCFEAGVLSSATIMVAAAATKKAVAFANKNKQFSFGLHLCLTDEMPVCDPSDIPSLITPLGLFWPTRVFMIRSLMGMVKQEDLKTEIRAQVNRLSELGVPMSHLDGHGHMHRLPNVLRAIISLKDELGLKCIRPAQDLYLNKPRLPFGKWLNRYVNRKVHSSFRTPDHFLMTTGKIDEKDFDWFQKSLVTLPDGVTEIGVHPGIDEGWRRLDTEFLLANGKRILADSGVSLISYSEIK